MNPFEYLNSINDKSEYLTDLSGYDPYLISRGLSLFPDTVIQANEMNKYHWLDKKLQYDYLFYSVRKKKRFSKWPKSVKDENLEIVKEYFGYSSRKAQEVLRILTANQIMEIKEKLEKGGLKNGKSKGTTGTS